MGMTNRDWLFSLPLDDQVAWMNAEHQDGTLDGDTAALNAKIAYPMHHGYKGVKADMVIFDELHDEHDSREKLEVEASELVADYAASGEVCDPMYNGIIELLDRQAAITEEKTRYKWVTASAEEIAAWRSKAEKLKEQVYELTAERDKLQEQLLIGWECECRLQAERERYREKFGKCLDYADAIHALMDDEGLA